MKRNQFWGFINDDLGEMFRRMSYMDYICSETFHLTSGPCIAQEAEVGLYLASP